MLNVMRKHAGSWMIKVILFAIVIVFVFWGVGSFRSREASRVATVNDELIGVTEYRRAYNNLIDQYRQRFGTSLNDGMIEMLQIKSQALNQLIDRAIILQEAEKLGLQVSDSEIADAIMKTPVFQVNGSFDSRRYRTILAQVHLTPEGFEAEQRDMLLGEKLTRLVVGAAKVSEAEAHQWYDWQNTKVNVDYVSFVPKQYEGIEPSTEEIESYFESEKENYKTEPKIKARYVVFDPAAYQSEVKVAEDDIVDYYDANLSDFKIEKMVEARHILLKLDPDANEDEDRKVKENAEAISKLARDGEDFAALAKERSEGPTRDNGGYLGKFTRSQMVKPFADKAFSMNAGDISDPVKTQFGWHVIKVESVEEASTKSIEKGREEIISVLTEREARNLAYDRAELFYEGIFEKEDFVKNAETSQMTIMETGLFTRQGPKSLGNDKNGFAESAFSLKTDEVSDILEIGEKYYLIQLMESVDAAVPPLEEVISDVTKDLIQKIQNDKAMEDAEAMAKDLSDGKAFDESAKQRNKEVTNTGFFGRNVEIPGIGSDTTVGDAAFQLADAGDTSEKPIQGMEAVYLLKLVERKTPEAEGFEKERDNIANMLLQQKQRSSMQEWIEDRKSESRITIEKEYLE
jgi:peptidyl-prolyl cis-trans isomerase D